MTTPRRRRGPAKKKPSERELERWHAGLTPIHEELGAEIEHLLRKVLLYEEFEFQQVTHRTKSWTSYKGKAARLRDPQGDIDDFCGVRVITYFVSETVRVARRIAELFEVDPADIKDKTVELGPDRMGYRGVHLVATISGVRLGLAEWKKFDHMRFEVQVTTILGHAWAQFEHDRGYKFALGKQRPDLERRLRLAAGLLETADREFDEIARDVADYGEELAKSLPGSSAAELKAIDLDYVSVREFLIERLPKSVEHRRLRTDWQNTQAAALAIDELTRFGIRTLADLNALIPNGYDQAVAETRSRTTMLGVIRDFMMIADKDRYFTTVWRRSWDSTDDETWSLLAKFGVDFGELEKKYQIRVDPADSWDDVFPDEGDDP